MIPGAHRLGRETSARQQLGRSTPQDASAATTGGEAAPRSASQAAGDDRHVLSSRAWSL